MGLCRGLWGVYGRVQFRVQWIQDQFVQIYFHFLALTNNIYQPNIYYYGFPINPLRPSTIICNSCDHRSCIDFDFPQKREASHGSPENIHFGYYFDNRLDNHCQLFMRLYYKLCCVDTRVNTRALHVVSMEEIMGLLIYNGYIVKSL